MFYPMAPALQGAAESGGVQTKLDGIVEILREMQVASKFQFESFLEEQARLKIHIDQVCEGLRWEIRKDQKTDTVVQERFGVSTHSIAQDLGQGDQAVQSGGAAPSVQDIVHNERKELQAWMEEQVGDMRKAVIQKQHESDNLFLDGNESIMVRLTEIDDGLTAVTSDTAFRHLSIGRAPTLPTHEKVKPKGFQGAKRFQEDDVAFSQVTRWKEKEPEFDMKMELLSLILISTNFIFVVIDSMKRGVSESSFDLGVFWPIVDIAFVIAFAMELFLRFVIEGPGNFCCRGKNRWWNRFDSVVVALDVIRVPLALSTATTPRIARTIRLIRLARVLTMFRMSFVASLRLFVASFSAFVPFMIYNFALQGAMVLVVSILFTHDINEFFIAADETHHFYARVVEQHSTLLRSIWTLLVVLFGGALLEEVLGPLRALGGLSGAIFIGWFLASRLLVFAGLSAAIAALPFLKPNILRKERAIRLNASSSPIQVFRRAFTASCINPVEITLEELESLLNTGRYDQVLKEIDLDRGALLGLFQLLDIEQDGIVLKQTLLNTMASVRDQVDTISMIYGQKRMIAQMRELAKDVRGAADSAANAIIQGRDDDDMSEDTHPTRVSVTPGGRDKTVEAV